MPTSILNDWYTNGTYRSDQRDDLWRDKNGEKALYDPCPAGWRVMHQDISYNDMTGMDTHFTWDATRLGGWVDMPPGTFTFLPEEP